MFNIRNILNRRNEQSRSPESLLPRTPEEGVESNASSAEGFLCPHCFLAFPTADLLQNHYESSHSDGINDVSGDGRELFNCPACKMKLGSEIELKSHYERHHSDKKEEFEIEVMTLQVKALEEGKSLLQSELEAVRLQSSELMKENIKIRGERDGLELKAAKLAGELADLKAAIDELKTQKLSAESNVKLSEERIKKLEVEIQQRPEADDVTLLQKELVSVQKMMDQLTLQKEAEKDTLQKQCSSIQDTCLRLQADKTELENILKSSPKKEEMESLQAKISEMSLIISQLQREIDLKEVEKCKLQTSLEKYGNYEEIKSLVVEKQNFVEEMLRTLTEKDELISKLQNELKLVKENVEKMKIGREKLFSKIEEGEGASVAILQLKEENAQLQEKFLHQQMLYGETAHKTESKMEELHTLLKKANSELQASNEKCHELETYLTQSQKELQELHTQNHALVEELNLKIANLTASSAGDKARVHSLEEGIEKKSKELDEMKHLYEKLQNAFKNEKYSYSKTFENFKEEKSNLENKLTECNKKLFDVQANLSCKENKLSQTQENLAQVVQELETERESKSKLEIELIELQKNNEETKQQLVSIKKLLAEYEESKVEFCNKISSLNEELSESHLKVLDLSSALENINEEKSKISEKCLSLEEKNKSLTLSITSLQNEKNSLLSELEKVKKAVSDLTEISTVQEKGMKELTESCQKEKNNSERISRDYELAKELYSKEKVRMQKQIENLENDCAKQLAQIQERVKYLENQLEEVEEKNAAVNSTLEETKDTLNQKELEWEEKQAHHIAQVEVLTENIKTLREDLSSEQKRRGNVEQKLGEISGTKLELEAKLGNALDERKELLERCLRSEAECERLQKSTTEMRRKYEDCVAALQELGRENQTLQVENMKHITRKWADDAEVTHCTACGKLFTVTIRKHHCRNCGNIFCNECSAKTATVASSKKPVRVCDVCYGEVTK